MSRIINFDDGSDSSTTPTIGNITASGLAVYANDAAYEAAESGAPLEGNIYFNSTTKRERYYNGTEWRDKVDPVSTDTLENKSVDGLNNTITNLDADEVIVDTISGLTAGNAQDAFAEHQSDIETNATNISTNASNISDNASDIVDLQNNKQDISEKGANNGYAGLDSGGKVPAAQLPSTLMDFKGTWDASTNTPTLANGSGSSGDVYDCNTAGTVDFGAGNITFKVGDWAVYNGTIWELSINSDEVGSVNGQTGIVVLDPDDLDDTSTTNKFANGSITTHSDVGGAAPSDGEVLTWINSNNRYEPQAASSGGGIDTIVTTSTNYTILTADDLILCDTSGGGITIDLPAAASSTNRILTLKKTTSDFDQVTIDANSSETIDGQTTTTLNTENESIKIVCDGTEWFVLERNIPSEPVSFAMAITDSVNTSVKSASPVTDTAYWWREGKFIVIDFAYYHQSTTGIAGTGIYKFKLPSGLNLDSTYNAGGSGNSPPSYGIGRGDIGGGNYWDFTASHGTGTDPDHFNMVLKSSSSGGTGTSWLVQNSAVGAASYGFNNTFQSINGRVKLPIAGWDT